MRRVRVESEKRGFQPLALRGSSPSRRCSSAPLSSFEPSGEKIAARPRPLAAVIPCADRGSMPFVMPGNAPAKSPRTPPASCGQEQSTTYKDPAACLSAFPVFPPFIPAKPSNPKPRGPRRSASLPLAPAPLAETPASGPGRPRRRFRRVLACLHRIPLTPPSWRGFEGRLRKTWFSLRSRCAAHRRPGGLGPGADFPFTA